MKPARLTIVLLVGCNLTNEGADPPAGIINFPIAAAMLPGAQTLFVVNSNFDLQYNAGSLHAYDVALIEAAIAPCVASPDDDGCPRLLEPSEVLADDGEVLIGTHAVGMDVTAREGGDARVYVAVRSESNLTYVDWSAAGGLLCGQGFSCDAPHRFADESIANERSETMPAEPVGVVAGPLEALDPGREGDFALMAHRGGQASLFLERGDAPSLVDVLDDLPSSLVNARFDPLSGTAWLPMVGADAVARVGFAIDEPSPDGSPPQDDSFAYDAGTLGLLGVDSGRESRDVAFDPDPLADRIYVLVRRRDLARGILSVVHVARRSRNADGSLAILRTIAVAEGGSRIHAVKLPVGGAGGTTRTFLFVSCFDARQVDVLDPELGTLVTVARGFSGPFAFVVDPVRQLLFVADFRSSVVRVSTLGPLMACLGNGTTGASCEPKVVANIGALRVIRELQ